MAPNSLKTSPRVLGRLKRTMKMGSSRMRILNGTCGWRDKESVKGTGQSLQELDLVAGRDNVRNPAKWG